MLASTSRILTTHTGSLPRLAVIADLLRAREVGTPISAEALDAAARAAITTVVDKQLATGLDVVNDGEQSKPSYVTYIIDRVAGFGGERRRRFPTRRDSVDFPEWARAAAPRGMAALRAPTCDGPLAWRDFDAVDRDIARLRAATDGKAAPEVFMTSASPGVISMMLGNSYYPTLDEFLGALAAIMQREYRAIVDAGFILQVDCPDLAASRNSEYAELGLEDFTATIARHIEALNAALEGLPRDRVRMHLCWGNYEGPHNHDVPIEVILPIVLRARVGAISFEGANPRHEHEWRVWRDVALPDEIAIIPGVIDSTTNFVEHPALVAERIVRYAGVVGRERVIGGVDCGFGTMLDLGGVDARVAWAKLTSLVEGAARASDELW
ncbi:MAG TPA: cobalamin-independent methionine synthase II family protein [Acidimicrobiales bacterium]|nr:cobalamin-independent methionine synthase II family protein [Acidimicrobiales bacterium]